MLAIDDLRKLAEMQKLLLERTTNNREENLLKYKNLVTQIDKETFANLKNKLNQQDEHNRSLEEELQFLESIKSDYEQLLQEQLTFKNIYEKYDKESIQLTDLSQINMEYIEFRINLITGYLTNKDNIEKNQKKLQKYNEELIIQEKNKELLSKRLKDINKLLRRNFNHSEGRLIKNGSLIYTSVITEYQQLEIDYKTLLEDKYNLQILLSKTNEETQEIKERLVAAKICANQINTEENQQIVEYINEEYLKMDYKLTMLKLLEMLATDSEDYDSFKKKINTILTLISHRIECLNKMGVKLSIDPFNIKKVLEIVNSSGNLNDNSKEINQLKKSIVELDTLVEEMIAKNSQYTNELSDHQDLFLQARKNSPEIVTINTWDTDDYFEEKKYTDNQVVTIQEINPNFGIDIAKQKTKMVIKRVNEMLSEKKLDIKEIVETPPILVVNSSTDNFPKLETLIPRPKEKLFSNPDHQIKEEIIQQNKSVDDTEINIEIEKPNKEISVLPRTTKNIDLGNLFQNQKPFEETQLFVDRVDDEPVEEAKEKALIPEELEKKEELKKSEMPSEFDFSIDLEYNEKIKETPIRKIEGETQPEQVKELIEVEQETKPEETNEIEEMPEVFWVVNDNKKEEIEEDNVVLSFEEQLKQLQLGDNVQEVKPTNNINKTRKLGRVA